MGEVVFLSGPQGKQTGMTQDDDENSPRFRLVTGSAIVAMRNPTRDTVAFGESLLANRSR